MQLATNAIEMAQLVLRRVLPEARILVDATAGNGNDTLFLAENSPRRPKFMLLIYSRGRLPRPRSGRRPIRIAFNMCSTVMSGWAR